MNEMTEHVERMAGELATCPDVLIVEDCPDDLTLMRQPLLDAGCFVSVACNAQVAIDIIRLRAKQSTPSDCHLFDIVFLDLKLPSGTGVDVLRVAHELMPAVPVVIVTGYANGDMIEDAAKVGFVGLIEKPLTKLDVRKVFDTCKIPLPRHPAEEFSVVNETITSSHPPSGRGDHGLHNDSKR